MVAGSGSREEHPYYAPEQSTAAALAVLLIELLSGRLAEEPHPPAEELGLAQTVRSPAQQAARLAEPLQASAVR